MAIAIPSDIVLDVARAADPERYRAAAERLANLRAANTAAEAAPSSAPRAADVAPAGARPVERPSAAPLRRGRRLDAFGQFEAFVLQSFVQSMLPKNATKVYGRGTAGEVWKSMLAERIGEELARSGQVGIAQRLAAGSERQRAADSEVAPAAGPSVIATTGGQPGRAAVTQTIEEAGSETPADRS